MADHHEIERTYGPVEPGHNLPDLSGVKGVSFVGDPVESRLEATYVDTVDLRLVRAGITLRRRVGGTDEGWHLTLPVGAPRDEVHAPLGKRQTPPPAKLRRLVEGRTRGADLVPVATVVTHRTTRDLLDENGTRLAAVTDDLVEGSLSGAEGADPAAWREWGVELVEGDQDLLAAIDELFSGAGLERSNVQRQVVRVLGARAALPPPIPQPGRKPPASRVLHARLAEQVEAVLRNDVAIRRGDHDGVHKVRVACRRLRTALATFRPLVDREMTDPLRDELRWLGRELAMARDAVVVRNRMLGLLDELPRSQQVGPVRRRVRCELDTEARTGLRRAQDTLRSKRYHALVGGLEALVEDPPWTPKAHRATRTVLPGRIRKDVDRVLHRMTVAESAPDGARTEAWHAARKAVKRLRYAAEALEPAAGKDARRLRKAARRLTRLLGAHQDAVVTQQRLESLAGTARAAGESDFTYGLLLGREQARARDAERRVVDERDRAARRLRAWP